MSPVKFAASINILSPVSRIVCSALVGSWVMLAHAQVIPEPPTDFVADGNRPPPEIGPKPEQSEMDADFSHDPCEIKNFLNEIKTYDLVLGSRYKDGVNVVNWPLSRLMLSLFANMYTRVITGLPVRDATGGFKCFKKEVLQAIDLGAVKSNGYAFQIEMTFKAWKKGFKIKEHSIVFTDRVKGTSKMSKKIVREAIFMVWKLRLASIFGILK